MSIPANSASSGSGYRKRRSRSRGWLMASGGPKQDRDKESDDRAEENPPRKFHHGQPFRLFVKLAAENFGNLVRQTAQDCDGDETQNHGEDVPEIVSAAFRQHADEEAPKKRAVGVTENSQDDRDDPNFGIDDDEIGGG